MTSKRVKGLTYTQIDQLETYCKMIEIEGYYYGSKPQFDARHEQIKQWIKQCKEKFNDNQQASTD